MAGPRTAAKVSTTYSLNQNDNRRPSRTIKNLVQPRPLKLGNTANRPPLFYVSSVQESRQYIAESSNYLKEEKKSQGFFKGVYRTSATPANDRLALLKKRLGSDTAVLKSVVASDEKEDLPNTLDRTKNLPSSTLEVTPANDRLTLLQGKLASDTTVLESVRASDEKKNLPNTLDRTKNLPSSTLEVTPSNDRLALLQGRLASVTTVLEPVVPSDKVEDLVNTLDRTINWQFSTLEEARQSWATLTNHNHQQTKLESVFTHDEKPHDTIEEVTSPDAMPSNIKPSSAHNCFTQAAQEYYKLQKVEEQKKKQQNPSNRL